MKQIIIATSANQTQFCYNSDNGTFVQYDDADLTSDHFECDAQTIGFAQDVADRDGLTNVELINNPDLAI